MPVEEMEANTSVSEVGMVSIKTEPPDSDDELVEPQVGLVTVKAEPIENAEENGDQEPVVKSEFGSDSENGPVCMDALELATVKLETEDSGEEHQLQPMMGFSIGKWKRKLAGIMKAGPLAKVACGVGDGVRSSTEVHTERQIKSDISGPSIGKTFFPCTKCGEKFKEKDLLEDHMKKHDSSLTYRCSVCRKSFFEDDLESYAGRVTSNRSYMTMKTPEFENNYICFKCGSVFKDKDDIIGHIRTHVAQNSYVCKVCFNKIVNHLA